MSWHYDNPTLVPLQLVLASLCEHHRLVAYLFPLKYFSNYELNEKFYHFGHHIIHASDFLCIVFYATRLVNSFHLYETIIMPNGFWFSSLILVLFCNDARLGVFGKVKGHYNLQILSLIKRPFQNGGNGNIS